MVVKRPTLPFESPEGVLFTLKDLTYIPETPRMKQPFTVKGKVELFKIPLVTPIWVQAKVTYPERWWEEIIPIIGGPTISEGATVFGGNFEIKFPRGFDREGEFILEVEVYLGPTYSIDSIVLPPFPPVASEKTTFLVAGEVPEEELGFRNFKIVSYSKNGGTPVTPPSVLTLNIGDRCRVNVGFDHRDGAVTGKFHAAIGNYGTFGFDEILNAEKAFSVPTSTDWKPYATGYYIDIPITSAISPGSGYDLYVKIMGITGGDIFTPVLDNVITIVGVQPEEADIKDFDFKLTKGTYELGARVPFTAPYDYRGIAQDGQLTISIGTGVYPTFNPLYTYEPIPVEFPAAGDWEHRGLEGNITLPDVLEAGQTYSVRAKLETLEIKAQETDTDWSAFDIIAGVEYRTLEIDITPSAGGYVTTSPAPLDIENHWTDNTRGKFEYGTRVRVTAHPASGYKFDHWSDEIEGGVSYDNPEWVSDDGHMYDNKAVKAHFREEVVEEYTLSVSVDPYGGGTVTKSPDKTKYAKGEYVTLTATPAYDYDFDRWSGDVTGYSASVTVVMDKSKSVVANFEKKLPDPYTKVTFTVKGDGFPFLTSYWILYHYGVDGGLWQDYLQHRPGDIITVRNVTSQGKLSCFCCSSVTGEWSEQKYSREFLAEDGEDYRYDIASGIVYYQ